MSNRGYKVLIVKFDPNLSAGVEVLEEETEKY
jgi:hypothetical protein